MHLSEPLHTASIAGQPLRFFKTPWNDGRPDLPWHSVDDLQRILGFGEQDREFCMRTHKKSEFPLKVIATREGVVSIAPHYAAMGLIGALSESGTDIDDVERAYVGASYKAAKQLTGALQGIGFMAWALAALDRHDE